MKELRGVYTVVATAFDAKWIIDFAAFGDNLDSDGANGGYGVVIAGTLAE